MENIDLEKWLELNRERFITYTLKEVADVAIASGFSQDDVDLWIRKTVFTRRVA